MSISGRVVSERYAVKEAQITFIDNSDTTKKYVTVTQNNGTYNLDLQVTSLAAFERPVRSFSLAQNYPNPFSSSTAIAYKLKTQAETRVTIYDILGREIKQFRPGVQNIGDHSMTWDGTNQFGEKITAGIYFYRLQAGGQSLVRKMLYNSNFHSAGLPAAPVSFSKNNYTQNSDIAALASSFTIRLENTATTLPYIIEQQIENVLIRKDTTLNFSLDNLPTATIDFNDLQQVIRGFGAANILMWRQDMTDAEIETAFGTGNGQLGFTILRLMVEADKNRWSLYIPTAKKAHDMGATIIASPWYAPEDMVETVNNVSRVRYDKYAAYAAHLDSFVTYMKANGVPIYGLSVQNEPDITDQWTSWTTDEMFTFMRDHAHAISGTNVMAPESFQFRREMSDPILNDSLATANTDIICGHIYGGGLASYPLAEQKGKEVWMTEYLINSGNPVTDLSIDTGWAGAMQTAQSIIGCLNAGMNAYVWWYIVRYYGPIADGTYANKGDVTKKGYVMSQFSQFVRPGDFRVYSKQYPLASGVYFSAYKDTLSSKEVVVAVNDNSDPQEIVINIQNGTQNIFTPYTTSEFKNMAQDEEININTNKIILTLEASSITTFVSME